VVLAGRRPEALDETARLAAEAGQETLTVPADVSDSPSVAELFRQVRERFGRLDLLFNNAGINVAAVPLEDLTIEQWQSVVNTNLTGVFFCTREAFRLMKEQDPRGGRIINNGSVSAHVPRLNAAAYTATKHAVAGLTKSTSLEGRSYDIACGQIDIGNALTDLSSRTQTGTLQSDGSTAVEPMMNVDDVARAVVYMASLPLEANVQFMTVMATKMPLVGRG
jgi:NAD(P)-dependent dehydrogenase (short-subunit alcohol dehydrogenase family)